MIYNSDTEAFTLGRSVTMPLLKGRCSYARFSVVCDLNGTVI
jgi:hypothetical protein